MFSEWPIAINAHTNKQNTTNHAYQSRRLSQRIP